MKENYITIGNRIQNNTLNPDTNKPYPNIDKNYGPYHSIDEALSALPNTIRCVGLKFGVITDEGIVEYQLNNKLQPIEVDIKYIGRDLIKINGKFISFDNTVIKKNDINLRFFGFNEKQLLKSNNEQLEIYRPNGNRIFNITDYKFELFDKNGTRIINIEDYFNIYNRFIFKDTETKIKGIDDTYIKLSNYISINIKEQNVFFANDNYTSVKFYDNDILKAGNLDYGQGFELKCPNNINPVISAYDNGIHKNQVYIQYPNDHGNAIEIKYYENEHQSSIKIIADQFLCNGTQYIKLHIDDVELILDKYKLKKLNELLQ